MICREFRELHGDRHFGDDPAIKCGLARIGGHKVMLIGHHKGRDTKEKVQCYFGLAHPEGYRKALRCMKLAEKFGLPVVTLDRHRRRLSRHRRRRARPGRIHRPQPDGDVPPAARRSSASSPAKAAAAERWASAWPTVSP